MADRPRGGMGRGLAAILAISEPPVGQRAEDLRQLPVELVRPNPSQPRRHFDEESIVALADSIKTRGVLQPVLVRPVPGGTYELVAGERRWRAAQLAEFETIPALVRPHDNAASLEVALVENMAREDLNPVDAARAVAALTEELGISHEEVGRRVGRSRVAISNLLRLLELPDEALDLLADGSLTEGHGRALLTARGNAERRRLARDAAAAGWSVRELERRARAARPVNPRARRLRPSATLHPDQEDALVQISDALETALGREVEITATAEGYRAHLTFGSLDEALELAQRLGVKRES